MGEQWKCLSPAGTAHVAEFRDLSAFDCFDIREPYTRVRLSTAELDNLIAITGRWREVPEVRALAEDLREATLICQGQLALNRHIGNVTVTEEWEQRIGRYMLHLAPFEEVPDATE